MVCDSIFLEAMRKEKKNGRIMKLRASAKEGIVKMKENMNYHLGQIMKFRNLVNLGKEIFYE